MRCLLFCLLLTTTCIAQRQLTNFRSSDPVGSNPAGFVTFAGRGYFLATDAAHGRNLWTSDGTPEGSRFFYELEPNKPTSAEFIPFVTDDYLYIFSRSNLFRIDKQHTITRLSSLSLTQPARPERVGDRLFFDAFQYVDLTTGLIQTEDPTRPLPSTIYFQSYRSETARLIVGKVLCTGFKPQRETDRHLVCLRVNGRSTFGNYWSGAAIIMFSRRSGCCMPLRTGRSGGSIPR